MRTTTTMLVGLAILALALGAWLYAATHGIDTDFLWSIITPLLMALFIGNAIGTNTEVSQKAADAAQTAATQTNGSLGDRVKAAVSSALADRDAARTRQAQGDVSADGTTKLVREPVGMITPARSAGPVEPVSDAS